jgi:hypothetical protein
MHVRAALAPTRKDSAHSVGSCGGVTAEHSKRPFYRCTKLLTPEPHAPTLHVASVLRLLDNMRSPR